MRTRRETSEQLLDRLERVGRRGYSGRRVRSSLEEYRSLEGAGVEPTLVSPEAAWWRYALASGSAGDPKLQLDLAEQRALSKASGAVGAYLVPSDLEQLIMSVAHTRGTVARLAKTLTTTTGDVINLVVASTHGSAAVIAEAGTYVPSDEALSNVPLGAFKVGSSIVLSEELSADALVGFDQYLADELGARIAQVEGTKFTLGSGTGEAAGCVAGFAQLAAATGSSTKFTEADLVNALHTVASTYRDQGGAWLCSDGELKSLRTITNAGGDRLLWDKVNPPLLLGFPVYVDENLAAPAANAKSLLFAGWQAAYVIRRVAGVSVQRQVEIYSNSGQLGYRANHRHDGRVAIQAAGVTLAHSAT
jgi:HK97 family phage major capsid protein